MKGMLISDNQYGMHQYICGITNMHEYDSIYRLQDDLAGSLLFIKNNEYVYMQCGSGVPIIHRENGILA